jgi:hypothetical protein
MRRDLLQTGGGGGVWPLAGRWMTVSDHPSLSGGEKEEGSVLPTAFFHLAGHPMEKGRECWGAADQTQERGRTTSCNKG